MADRTKIFYDGNCVVCDLEIAHYKRKGPAQFELVDISAPDFRPADFGLRLEDVNRDLHVLTPTGELRVGVDAFAHIWDRLDTYRKFGQVIRLPVIYPLAKLGYRLFTIIRPYLPKKGRL